MTKKDFLFFLALTFCGVMFCISVLNAEGLDLRKDVEAHNILPPAVVVTYPK